MLPTSKGEDIVGWLVLGDFGGQAFVENVQLQEMSPIRKIKIMSKLCIKTEYSLKAVWVSQM